MALVFATLSEGYDPIYVWRQADHGPAKDAPGWLNRGRRERL